MQSRTKRVIYFASMIILTALAIELASAFFLFYFQKNVAVSNIWAPGDRRYLAYADGPSPVISVVNTLIARLRPPPDPVAKVGQGAHPKVFWGYDASRGWNAREGVHKIVFSRPRDQFRDRPPYHDWTATIRSDGSRATSREPAEARRKIRLFGDSWLFGWGLDDEFTLGWLLQSEYRDTFAVWNHSSAGWGHTHALINFRRLKESMTEKDVLIFGYAQFLLPRNTPHPSVIKSMSHMMKNYRESGKPLGYPRAKIENGEIMIDILPLDCAKTDGYCDRKDFTLAELEAFTIRLFDEIIDSTEARIIVLQIDGPDDPVLKHLRSRGVEVVDGRAPADLFGKDTMNPYDAHPGPISNHYWFTQLRPEIDRLITQD